jgi:hypothetical protein
MPYLQIFSQAMHSDPSAIKRSQKAPLPFVFELPLLQPSLSGQGGCTLTGLVVNKVVHFLAAVGFMFGSQESRWTDFAEVVKIETVDYLGNRTIISQNGSLSALDRFYVLSLENLQRFPPMSSYSPWIRLYALKKMEGLCGNYNSQRLQFSGACRPLPFITAKWS